MTWIVGGALILLGGFLALLVGSYTIGLYNLSDMEGGNGAFVFFIIMPLGALLGAGLAFWLLPRDGAMLALLRQGGIAAAILLALAGGSALLLRMVSPAGGGPTAEGKPLILEIELMAETPESLPENLRALELHAELASTWEKRAPVTLHFDQGRREGDFIVIPGDVPLNDTYEGRILYPIRGEEYGAQFNLALPGDPGLGYQEWSAWEKASTWETIGQRFQLRYRVRPAAAGQ